MKICLKIFKILFIAVVIIQLVPLEVNAQNEGKKKMIARIPEASVVLYAEEKGGNFEDFSLEIDGALQQFPNWKNVTNATYAPKLFYNDINHDKKKELIIVLTTGYGTGILENEAHVFQKIQSNIGEVYQEILVDSPMAIVLKNVKTELTKQKAVVNISNEKTVFNIGKIETKNLFNDIYFGNIVTFSVSNNQLKATVAAQISPLVFIGNVPNYLFIQG